MISYFVFQQVIFTNLFEMVNCEDFKFDEYETKTFLRNYLGIECSGYSYFNWIYFIVGPSFFLYGILIPLTNLIFTNIKKIDESLKGNLIKYDLLRRQAFNPRHSSFWFQLIQLLIL